MALARWAREVIRHRPSEPRARLAIREVRAFPAVPGITFPVLVLARAAWLASWQSCTSAVPPSTVTLVMWGTT